MADIYQIPTEDISVIEYKVRPVQRFVVTRFHRTSDGASASIQLGEFPAWDTAFSVATALAEQERQMRGLVLDDPRIQFPGPMEVPGE